MQWSLSALAYVRATKVPWTDLELQLGRTVKIIERILNLA